VNDSRLNVLLGGRRAAEVTRERGQIELVYLDAWRESNLTFPVSLNLPMSEARHGHHAVAPVLEGLLPDDPSVLDGWGRRFHVSRHNPFGLLAAVGEDCAGALQFVRDERLDEVLSDARWEIRRIDEGGVEERLRALRRDPTAWLGPRVDGRFSLAGAQPKFGVHIDRSSGHIGIPSGRAPTTHIVKPPVSGLDGFAENEHVCLELARAVGLPSASSCVRRFGSEVAIVVERFDRVWVDDPNSRTPIVRVHQEDLCQALCIPPVSKYQNEGGPGPHDVVQLLRRHSSRPVHDVALFVDALLFNWLIGGTDAHAKNYSLLIGTGGKVRLAPLYDLASATPYTDLDPRRIQSAMKIGGQYRLYEIRSRQWRELADLLELDSELLIERARTLAGAVRAATPAVIEAACEEGLERGILNRLGAALPEQVDRCERSLAGS